MRRLIATGMMFAAAAAATATEPGGKDEGKQTEAFARNKMVKSQGFKEKIDILQAAQACVQSAQSFDAVQACETKERSAFEEHQRKMKERWEAMKNW